MYPPGYACDAVQRDVDSRAERHRVHGPWDCVTMVPSGVSPTAPSPRRARCHRDDRDACQVAGNGIVLQPKPGSDRTLSDSLRLIVASGPSRGSTAGSRTSAMTCRTASLERACKPTPHPRHGVRYGLNAVRAGRIVTEPLSSAAESPRLRSRRPTSYQPSFR